MNAIVDWFKDQDFNKGVELYSQLPGANPRVLSSLARGKSDRNLSLLCKELRRFKKTPQKKTAVKAVKKIQKPVVQAKPQEPQEQEKRAYLVGKSANTYFKKIKYGELPAELKIRFRLAKDIFYDMCDLKFALNDLPDSAENQALELQLQIEALDEQRETIWKELEHWQEYKTMLPTKADEDFSDLPPQKLFLKKANLASSISKISRRIEGWEKKMEEEPDKQERLKISQQINRSQKKLHQHEINMRKIEELL